MKNEVLNSDGDSSGSCLTPDEIRRLTALKDNLYSPSLSEFVTSKQPAELAATTGLNGPVDGEEIFNAIVGKKTDPSERARVYFENMAFHYENAVKSIRSNPLTKVNTYRSESGEEESTFTFSYRLFDRTISVDYTKGEESGEYLQVIERSYNGENESLQVNPDGTFEYLHNADQTYSGRGKKISVTWNNANEVNGDLFRRSEQLLKNIELAHQNSLRDPQNFNI